MNLVLRGVIVYLVLLLIFRIMGKRTLNQTTTFDFILLLIISETTQQAMIGEDFSITASAVLICTLMGLDLIFSLLREKFPVFGQITEGAPLVIVDKGRPLRKRMDKAKVDEDDVLHAARASFGLQKMEEVKYAVLEKDGSISIVPFEEKAK